MANPIIHDIEVMKQSCALELQQTRDRGSAPAPYWFERVAILSRKAQDYEQEIAYCEAYLNSVDALYARGKIPRNTGVAMGPTHQAIVKRLAKARQLLAAKGQSGLEASRMGSR